MKISILPLMLFAIVLGALLTAVAQVNGYVSNDRLKQFDAWLCQQSWFEDQSPCRIDSSDSSKIDLDELIQRSPSDELGNWKVANTPQGEEQAIKEITAIRILIESEEFTRKKETAVLSNIYAQYWPNYPEFVAASRCMSCANQRSVLKNLGNSIKTSDHFLKRFSLSNAEMLPLITQGVKVASGETDDVKLMAELLYNGGSHSLISPVLIQKKEWASVTQNIYNGGAYGALSKENLNDIPEKIVIQAWQRAMSRGQFDERLTKHLLLKGYRPALRLIVWLQAGDYDYLRYSQAKNIVPLLNSHSDFGQLRGEELANFYSENWRQIRWDSSSNKWLSN